MPVNDPNVVDAISLDPSRDVVEMQMFEERNWLDTEGQLRDLQAKMNAYIGYVLSGQLSADTQYANRPVTFILHCQYEPPPSVVAVLHQLADHLRARDITLRVVVGHGASSFDL